MSFKTLSTFAVIVALIFVTVGDRVFPAPFNQISRNTRTSIDQFILGLFPQKEVTRPSQAREDQMGAFEKRANPLP